MEMFSRRTKIIAAFVIVVGVGYVLVLFWKSKAAIPPDFTNARTQGAIIAQNIVNMSNQSALQLEKINEDDQNGNYTDALNLTVDLFNQSEQLRDQAVSLSNQLESMTRALSGVDSVKAQQAALEAISSRLALVNQLVNYSGDLGHLLQVLQSRFAGHPQSNAQVQAAVNQINTDVNAINNFNGQAEQAMAEFDKLEK